MTRQTPALVDARLSPMSAPGARDRAAAALDRFRAPDGNPWRLPLRAALVREVHRPFSWLGWYELTGVEPARRVVVKAHRTVSAQPPAEMIDASAARRLAPLFVEHQNLGVVTPLRTDPDLGVVITAAVDAESLGTLIEAKGRWWPRGDDLAFLDRGCTLAGRWLRVLHESEPVGTPWTTDHLREDLLTRVRLLREFHALYGLRSGLASAIERWLERQLPRIHPAHLACSVTHRDYSPSNMLYDGNVLLVLDFSTLREGPRMLDATRFLHQIDMLALKPRYRPVTRRHLQAAYVTGYGDTALLSSPASAVFMARHSLAHWLGIARRVRAGRPRVGSLLVCRAHRLALARIAATS